jgi:hypothetical protein
MQCKLLCPTKNFALNAKEQGGNVMDVLGREVNNPCWIPHNASNIPLEIHLKRGSRDHASRLDRLASGSDN